MSITNSGDEVDIRKPLPKSILRENSLLEPEIRNPFVHRLNFTLRDRVKIGFNAVVLLPIRAVAILTLSLIAVVFASITTCGIKENDLRAKPLEGWRKHMRMVLRFLGRSIFFCCGFHKIRKNGIRAKRNEATIFVAAPHSSFLDVLVFFVLGLPSGVSRSENAKLPIAGYLVKALQPILVTREDSKNKLFTIEEIKRRSDPGSDWPQLLVFPEGTTTNRTCLIAFKPGAFIPGLPVQPVVVEYRNRTDTITWTWEGLSAAKVIFYTLCQFNNRMEVTYLPVYYPNEQEKSNAKLFARNVRARMANHLNVLTTNHTYEDCRLMLKARELNLPLEAGLIEFDKIKEKLNVNYDSCQEILVRFTKYASKKDGKMSLNDFAAYLDLPPTGVVKQIFNLYDRDFDGYITFREFLIGFMILSLPVNTEDTMKLAFSMFDKDGKGYISLGDLQSILFSSFSMPGNQVEALFKKVDAKNDGYITYDELKAYASEKPEYSRIFLLYNQMKELRLNSDSEKQAKIDENENLKSLETFNKTDENTTSMVTKRPLSDKNLSQSKEVSSTLINVRPSSSENSIDLTKDDASKPNTKQHLEKTD